LLLPTVMTCSAKDNPEAANKVACKIWETTRILSDHPAMGRSGRVSGTRELVISGTSYIVPYRLKADEVQILRVLHAARKWPEKF
jgi:toxin ParE1/3/4